MTEVVIRHIQARIAELRRVNEMSHDPRIRESVLKMIAEMEEDVIRLSADEPSL